jgi:membrane-associated phospholipid phosphatase
VPRRTWRRALEHLPRPVPRPLLPAAVRPLTAALLAACVAVTVLLGAWFRHHTRAGWLDTAVDVRVQASLGGHLATLNLLAGFGDPVPVTAMTAALLLVCLATRRWRGAVLVTVAVPAAAALTQLLLKPLIGRTLQGDLSFPSGTATGVFALAAAFAVLLAGPVRPRMPAALRLLLALAAFLAAGAVAVALVGLGIHYFTDTVGGAAVGTAVVLATALILDRLGPSRQWLEAGYRLGSDRGSPNHGSTLLSKRVMAQIRSPVRVRTNRPVPWRMPVGARR